jgi:UDP-3-O-[3-hydroxymyristoyl] glucosamine N-acyltransferase
MEFTAAAIAGFLKGEVVGNPDAKVNNVAKIEEGHPGALSFLANPKYEHFLYTITCKCNPY